MKPVLKRALPCLVAAACVGCFHAAFQHPAVLEPGRLGGGIGVLYVPGREDGFLQLDLMGRYGIRPNLDAGLRWSIPSFTLDHSSVMLDGKYRLVRDPAVAASAGVSYSRATGFRGKVEHVLALHPTLIAGSERVFGGIRLPVWWTPSQRVEFTNQALFVAGSFGNRLRLQPELELVRDSESGGFGRLRPGLGFNAQFGAWAAPDSAR